MSEFTPVEKGVPIRNPSTANLLISSQDRYDYSGENSGTAGQFTIQKKQAILNGFFTRIAPVEVALRWDVPNVYDISGADPITTIDGRFWNANVRVDITGGSITNVSVPFGLYTIAQALDALVAALNAASLGATFSITQSAGTLVNLTSTVGFRFPTTAPTPGTVIRNNFVSGLGFTLGGSYVTTKTISSGRPYPGIALASANGITPVPYPQLPLVVDYLDFASSQLTYNQELKDSSTAQVTRDIIYRWYFANEGGTPAVDKYGFAISPGMIPFYERRVIPFPKQIRWANTQPLGQLTFEVFIQEYLGQLANNLSPALCDGFEWFMTTLVSEV